MCDINPGGVIGGMFGGIPGAILGNMGGEEIMGWGGDEGPQSPDQRDYVTRQRSEYDQWAEQYTNPQRYAEMGDYLTNQQVSANDNRMASMGLAGSSAALGANNEAIRRTGFGMWDRQLRDRNAIEGTRNSMTGMLNSMDMAALNREIAAQNADSQMWGSILSAGGMIAGAAIGGPMGAGVGGQIGGMMGPQETPYMNMNYGGGYQGGPMVPTQGMGFNNDFGGGWSYPSTYGMGGF